MDLNKEEMHCLIDSLLYNIECGVASIQRGNINTVKELRRISMLSKIVGKLNDKLSEEEE